MFKKMIEKYKELPKSHKIGINATIGGAGVSGWMGAGMGIAAFGGAINGAIIAIPVAVVCGIGAFSYSRIKELKKELDEHKAKSNEDNSLK